MWHTAGGAKSIKKKSVKASPMSRDHCTSPYATKKAIVTGNGPFSNKRKSRAPICTESSKIFEEEIYMRYMPLNSFRFTTCMADLKYTLSHQNSPKKKQLSKMMRNHHFPMSKNLGGSNDVRN